MPQGMWTEFMRRLESGVGGQVAAVSLDTGLRPTCGSLELPVRLASSPLTKGPPRVPWKGVPVEGPRRAPRSAPLKRAPDCPCVVRSVVVVSLWTEVGSEANCLGSFVLSEGPAQLPSLPALAIDFPLLG